MSEFDSETQTYKLKSSRNIEGNFVLNLKPNFKAGESLDQFQIVRVLSNGNEVELKTKIENGQKISTIVESLGEFRIKKVESQKQSVPLSTKLHGNYPNPFNPETTLTFSLSEQSQAQLIIYNVLGQVVKTFNYQQLNPGT